MQFNLEFIIIIFFWQSCLESNVCSNHSAQLFSDDDGTQSNRQESVTEAISASQCLSQIYRKSLRLTSQQIVNNNFTLQTRQPFISLWTLCINLFVYVLGASQFAGGS